MDVKAIIGIVIVAMILTAIVVVQIKTRHRSDG